MTSERRQTTAHIICWIKAFHFIGAPGMPLSWLLNCVSHCKDIQELACGGDRLSPRLPPRFTFAPSPAIRSRVRIIAARIGASVCLTAAVLFPCTGLSLMLVPLPMLWYNTWTPIVLLIGFVAPIFLIPIGVLLLQVRKSHQAGGTLCPRCGYNLRGTSQGCSECGWNRERPVKRPRDRERA